MFLLLTVYRSPLAAFNRGVVMIACCRMTAHHVPEVFSLLNTFLTQDAHYLASSKAYGDGGEHALQQALDLFLRQPELGFVWVACEDREIVGVCVVCFAISTSTGTIVAKLDDVFVPVNRQNQGLGTKLLSDLAEELKKAGVTRIDTSVHHDNTDARRFYLKHGFRPLNEERLTRLL